MMPTTRMVKLSSSSSRLGGGRHGRGRGLLKGVHVVVGAATVLLLLLSMSNYNCQAQTSYMIGDSIEHEGYVIDRYCIEQGVFLDQPDLVSLENPQLHTVHCLIDAPPCIGSPFELLQDPITGTGDMMDDAPTPPLLYTRAFVLDEESKNLVVELAKQIGICEECDADGTGPNEGLVKGLRVRVRGTVTGLNTMMDDDAGPTVSLTSVEPVFPHVGQTVQLSQVYVSDQFCLRRGTFLDNGLPSLSRPQNHTVHCLIDPPVCVESPFEVLLPPMMDDDLEYQRAYTLDEPSKADIVNIIKDVGVCDTCNDGGTIVQGFQANLMAIVLDSTRNETSGSGPLINVTMAVPVMPEEPPDVQPQEEDRPQQQSEYEIGQEITVEGYVIDEFCLQRGTFLDTGLNTLENADRHTLHCLLDPPPCLSSPYELLIDPNVTNGETTWKRGFRLDDASKQVVIELGRAIGNCDTCANNQDNDEGDGEGQRAGLRIRSTATIIDNMSNTTTGAGPLISLNADNVESVGQYSIGQEIFIEGYIIDQFCIQRGTFLDTGLVTLENADKHTVHCLIDPPPCIGSSYEVLIDPVGESGNWTRGFTLDDDSKTLLVDLAKQVGVCDTCTGEGTLEAGFRAQLIATIVDNTRNLTSGSGPLISVSSAEPVLPEGGGGGGTDDGGDGAGIETEAETNGEATATCEVAESTVEIENVPISLTYELGTDEATGAPTFSAQVVYEGLGWLGFAISVEGRMLGSLAIIGLPDEAVSESNPGKYNLEALSEAGIVLTDQQTLMDGNIEQNETHTVLTFTKFLEEPDEISISATGENFFLVAAGNGANELSYHGTTRQPFTLALGCDDNAPVVEPAFAVGDEVTIEGFVMDNFCIERGTLLDEPNIVTLEQPNLHTLHCLLDVEQCQNSNYEILLDPLPGETLYRRGMTLDESSKTMISQMARDLGSCDLCDGGRLERGFRTSLTATVMEMGDVENGAPPIVSVSDAQPVLFITDSSTVVELEVGDLVTVTGFIMDNFCIERGTLLDAPSIVTLQEPDRHSVHCLIDVEPCAASNYEVLFDPAPGMEDPMYSRGFVLDDEGKDLIRSLAMEVGICDDCDGTGDWQFGFRAQIMGTVVDLGSDGEPPVISIREALPVPFEGMSETSTDDATDAPVQQQTTESDGPVDCSTFVASHVYEGLGLTLHYVVNVDEETGVGNFSGQVVYEGQGWVGFAISEEGSMVGSLAVIGLPDEEVSQTNPGKYSLGAQAVSGVTLTDQQTLLDGNIEQNETHTVLTFTKLLEEPGEIPIDVTGGTNFFLAAAGIENGLNFHSVRGVVGLPLSPCTAEGGGVVAGAAVEFSTDRMQSHFKAHGWLACLAWGILVPLAIGNSLCRHLIPVEGLWFQAHRALNSLAILMTICAFAIVVNALEQTQSQPDHFKPIEGAGAIGKHKTIGLVVFILSLIQGIGGVLRPHLPAKNDDGTDAEAKSAVRVAWEFIHKLSGVAILAMAWYQCHTGLVTYSNNFQADDYSDVFWGVTGAISGIVVIGGLTRFIMPAEKSSSSGGGGSRHSHSRVPNGDPSHLST